MRTLDTISQALQQIRRRFFESAVVVMALALGVGTIAGALTIRRLFLTDLSGRDDVPFMREIRVTPRANAYDYNRPVTVVGYVGAADAELTIDTLLSARDASPHVPYAYTSALMMVHLGDYPSGRPFAPPSRRDPAAEEESAAAESDARKFAVESLHLRPVLPDLFPAHRIRLDRGELISMRDVRDEIPVLVLGPEIAEVLFPGEDPLGQPIALHGTTFTVIGITAAEEPSAISVSGPHGGDMTAYVPFTAVPGFHPVGPDQNGLRSAVFAVDDPENLEAAVRELQAYFTDTFGPDLFVLNSSLQFQRESASTTAPLLLLISFLAGACLVIAAINIQNLMIARVVRRTRDIGISTALGAHRGRIFAGFLTESLILGVTGGAIGCGIAFGLTAVLRAALTSPGAPAPQLPVTGSVLALAFLITMAVNVIFGVYPAYRAARTNAAEALRVG